jgi:general stress protein 26
MSNAHPWLEQIPWTTKPLPRDMLEHRIQRALTLSNLGMLGTLGLHGPIVSPLEFYADKFTVYIFPQPGSPKLKAMQRDPRVSFAVANPMAGWVVAQGAQLFGKAELLDPGTADWEYGMTIFRWQASSAEIGFGFDQPPNGILMKLDPDRIVYTEHFLRKDGYGPRQIWRKDEKKEQASDGLTESENT